MEPKHYVIDDYEVRVDTDAEGVRWTCECPEYQRPRSAFVAPWCEHVARAMELRLDERMIATEGIRLRPREK